MPERFPLFHVKDGIRNGGPAFGWTMTIASEFTLAN